jgi:D-lactate dehydrogenase
MNETRAPPGPLAAVFLDALRAVAGEGNLLTEPPDCWPYGYDNSRQHALPQAVVFATDHAQIQALLRLCNAHGVPITPRGRGTGTTGATIPSAGGLVLSLERMDRILHTDPANRIMVVQPGVTNQAVQVEAAKHGFFWPPDPTSAAYCTIGGNLAYNSAGPRAVKYGTPRENTLGLQVVSGAGRALRAGVQTTKGVVGLDLTRLIIGSEGTLAVITEATLRLTPAPEAIHSLRAVYTHVAAAARAVSNIMAQAAVPRSLEFMDGAAIEMSRGAIQTPLPEDAGALLMIEADGSEACLDALTRSLARAARVAGCIEVQVARNAEEVRGLWSARKALSPALRNIAPGKISEDVVVPVSRLADLIQGLGQLGEAHGIPIVNFGHAGNGNIHVNLLVHPQDSGEMRSAQRCLDQVFRLVLELGGTLSGEHGVGLAKRDFVVRELGTEALALMRGIKRVFDPNGILNPDKMLPPSGT